MNRDAFLGRVREHLGTSGEPGAPPRHDPPATLSGRQLVERFAERARAVDTVVHVAVHRAAAMAGVAELVGDRAWTGDRALYPELPGHTDDALAADVGLVRAVLAVADSGTVALRHEAGDARRTSLLPPTTAILLAASTLHEHLATALPSLTQASPPPAMTLISGPSRTADIELQLVLGMHGPTAVHVWVIESE